MKVLENTPAVLSLGKLCDENGYSYEWINGQKPHLIKNGIRIQCNTENFVPIVVPGLSANSSSGSDSSTSRTLSRQESHCSTSSSSSSSSLTVSDTKTREREDRIESDISPVTVSTTDDERSGRPDVDQANKTPKTNFKKKPQKEREACKSSWSPRGNQKSFTLTILWNSAKPAKISPAITARLHHTDQKQMGLLKEQCAE